MELEYSVTQGSCVGSVVYLLFASTLEEVVNIIPDPEGSDQKTDITNTRQNIDLHGYADDHGVKKKFVPGVNHDQENQTTDQLRQCLMKIKH